MIVLQIETNPMLPFYVIGVLLLFFIFYIARKRRRSLQNFTKRLFVNKSSVLSNDEYKKIALGALYSEQQMAFINSMETGLDKDSINRITEDAWQINSEQDALETLEYLSHKGYEFYFPAVVAALNIPEAERNNFLNESFDDRADVNKAKAQLQHLEETMEELKNERIIQSQADMIRYGVAGWDVGRLVFMARLLYNAGYINVQQAWSYINHAQSVAKANFSSWRDFASSYIIGRALWGGRDGANKSIANIARYLLNDKESPWVKFAW